MFQRIRRALGFIALQGLEPRRLMASPVHVAAGDLDGDGFADLAIIHRDLATRNILLTTHVNDRKSGPGPTRASVSLTDAEYAGVAIADVNRDGRPDIVVAVNRTGTTAAAQPQGGPHVKVFAGDGQGGFATDAAGQPISRVWTLPAGVHDVYGVAAGDLDGDGSAEVVVNHTVKEARDRGSGLAVGRVTGGVSVFWSSAPGEPRTTFAVLLRANDIDENCDGLAIGDLDGDLSNEIVVYPRELNLNQPPENQPAVHVIKARRNQEHDTQDIAAKAAVQLNHHGSTTSSNQRYQSITFLGIGDLDGDGRAELLGLASGEGVSDVYAMNFKSDGKTGEWTEPKLIPSDGPTPADSATSALGDFDKDGLLDVVSYSTKSDVWSFGRTIKDGPKLVWSPKSNIFLYGSG